MHEQTGESSEPVVSEGPGATRANYGDERRAMEIRDMIFLINPQGETCRPISV